MSDLILHFSDSQLTLQRSRTLPPWPASLFDPNSSCNVDSCASPSTPREASYSSILTSLALAFFGLNAALPAMTLFLSTFFRSLLSPLPAPLVLEMSLRAIGFIRNFFFSSCEGGLRSTIHCGTGQPEARMTLTMLFEQRERVSEERDGGREQKRTI